MQVWFFINVNQASIIVTSKESTRSIQSLVAQSRRKVNCTLEPLLLEECGLLYLKI